MHRRLMMRALLAATAIAATAVAAPASAQRIDRIVAFGDSYADTGNALRLAGVDPASTIVYPTGRFTGGLNYVDYLAQLLAVDQENFAIGGARTNTGNQSFGLPGFTQEVGLFLGGGGTLGFPTVEPSFDEGDLVTVSIGGNDARAFQQGGGTIDGASAAAATAAGFAESNLDLLVSAGAPTISFLAGDTGRLPEIAGDPAGAAVRTAFSTAFNQNIQDVLAGYASSGVMVHYLDLSLVLDRIEADPAAFGLTGVTCPAFPNTTCIVNSGQGFLFYGDLLHPTSDGSRIIAQYIATQLQAPLTLEATSELGLATARQFGRTLSSRLDLTEPRDGGLAEGLQLFVVGDTFSRDMDMDDSTDAFDIDGVGVTAGISYGMGNTTVGIAANYSKPRARFGADVAETESTSWQVGAFGGIAMFGAFAQAYAGFGNDEHEIERMGVIDEMEADADGDHWLAGLKAGYLMPVGIMRAGPVVALDYAKADVDGYTETGDAALTLNVEEVSAKSLTGGIGAELRGDFEGGGVQLRPYASAMLEAELLGNGRSIRFAQTSAPGIVNTWEFEERSKDPYGRFSVGGNAAILSGVSLNAVGSTTVGKDRGDEVSAHVGLRFGF
jgi:outer membrane lipase/esterase